MAAALAAVVPLAAHAQDPAPAGSFQTRYDGDIDLIRPYFQPENLPGIDVPDNWRGGSVRWGAAFMYTNSPLVLYQFDEEVGAIIENRFTTFLGVSVDISRAFTARLSFPMYYSWGSQTPRYAANGFAQGDLSFGAHWAFYRSPVVGLGVRLDATVPTRRPDFYAGEPLPKLNPAFLAMFDVGIVRIALDVGANVRFTDLVTTEDLDLGPELLANGGVRVSVIKETLDVGAAVYGRFGFTNFLGAGESSGLFMADVAYHPVPWLWVDVGAGRGFTRGYGTSDVRVWAQLRFQARRAAEEEIEDPEGFGKDGQGGDTTTIVVNDYTGVDAGGEGDLEDPDPWLQGQIVRERGEQIEIRYELRFQVGTATLLEESFPQVDAVADLLNNNARIGHVVIEGHASVDGPFDLNYELSYERSKAIWERMLQQGVHPSRVSVRGMGEVEPADATAGYTDLEASRRVIFQVVRRYESWEEPPQYVLEQRYPWNGESYRAVQPRMPTAEEDIQGEVIIREAPARERPERDDASYDDVDFTDPADEEVDVQGEPPPDDATPPAEDISEGGGDASESEETP